VVIASMTLPLSQPRCEHAGVHHSVTEAAEAGESLPCAEGLGLGVYVHEITHSGAIRPGLVPRDGEVRSRLPGRQQACWRDARHARVREARNFTAEDVESSETW
jgi:hypothetical protein